MRVGSPWGYGYSIDVIPEEYVVVEHKNCPNAKRGDVPSEVAEGICVLRISKEQSKRFEAAIEPFKRRAIPLESYSFDDPDLRPDGKPCRQNWTDAESITFFWTGTDGGKMASYYAGCDPDEFKTFYESARAVSDTLPVQQIIKKD